MDQIPFETLWANLSKDYLSKTEQNRLTEAAKERPVESFFLNPEVLMKEELLSSYPFLEPDKKDPLLFRFRNGERMGKSLEAFGGGGYLLDPASASVSYYLAPLLPAQATGLDLCAAPGGKSITLALRRRDVLLFANDLSYSRMDEMRKNVERMGLTNVCCFSMDPKNLPSLPGFDFVILDAPCSGSGMFRKERKMAEDYSEAKVRRLLPVQGALLDKAATMLRKDGILAYSTCSLSVEEDEDQVKAFLNRHPEFVEVPIPKERGLVPGRFGVHFLPGFFDGEGLYLCLLRKKQGESLRFEEAKLKERPLLEGKVTFRLRKSRSVVDRMPAALARLHYLSVGLKVDEESDHPKTPFDHAFSKVLPQANLLPLDEKEALAYARGEEVRPSSEAKDGLVVVCYRHLRLGFGRLVQGRVKNSLPKGLRMDLFTAKQICSSGKEKSPQEEGSSKNSLVPTTGFGPATH